MSREVIHMARGRPAKCPYCGGSSINKGFRKTKTMGKRRIKLCRACRRKFTPKNQKPGEEDQERPDETRAKPDEVVEATQPAEPNQEGRAAAKPISDSRPLLNALDEPWTS